MKRIFILSVFFYLLLSGCRKDPVFIAQEPGPTDTVLPAPQIEWCKTDTTAVSLQDTIISDAYLAAYPGSWWQYSDGSYVSCELVKYGLIDPQLQHQAPNHYCVHYDVDSVYLPRLTGYKSWCHTDPVVYEDCFLKKMHTSQGYYKCTPAEYYSYTYSSKQVDDVYEWWYYSFSCDYATRKVNYIDTLTLPNGVVYDEVIQVTEEVNFYLNPSYETVVFDYYYNLDVGLIWQIESGSLFSPAVDRYLTSFYIAPH